MVALISDALASPNPARKIAAALLLDLLKDDEASQERTLRAEAISRKQAGEVARELQTLIEEHELEMDERPAC